MYMEFKAMGTDLFPGDRACLENRWGLHECGISNQGERES